MKRTSLSLMTQYTVEEKFPGKVYGIESRETHEFSKITITFRNGANLVFWGKKLAEAEQKIREYLDTGVYMP